MLKRLRLEILLTWDEVMPVLRDLLIASIALLLAIWIVRVSWLGWD